jgi:hypothetical protein
VDVPADTGQSHRELLGLVEALQESALAGAHRFSAPDALRSESIAGNTYEHHREHAPRGYVLGVRG